ncbi:MAG: DUF6600 domain-containing protein [bacterium]
MGTSRTAVGVALPALGAAALAGTLLVVAASGCAGTYGGGAAVSSTQSPADEADASYFWNDLAPYGRWVDYAPYGWCWVPDGAPPDWRPYEYGRWAYTDAGFCWASDDPWGWATDHYGRWTYDSFYGWIWVPGAVWAPAWVAWHCGDDWVGWAPLPPTATWDVAAGLHFADADRIPADQWCFVHRRQFVDAKLHERVVPVVMNERLLKRTRDTTRFGVRGGRPVNDGLDVRFLESGRVKVTKVALADVDSAQKVRQGGADRGAVRVFRPVIREETLRGGPPIAVRDHPAAASAPTLRKQYDKRRHDLEQSLARERSALQKEHANELRAAPVGSAAEIRGRQAAERQAFERRAEERRRTLEEQQRQGLAKAESESERKPESERTPDRESPRSEKRKGGS